MALRSKLPFEFPRKIPGQRACTVAFPIGGIGTGSVSLGGRGQLQDWEIFSKPDKGRNPSHSLSMVWVKPQGAESDCRIIESVIQPPYQSARGLGRDNLPGLPRFSHTIFEGVYPFAKVSFRQRNFPLEIELEAFNPFIPLNVDDSSLPIAVLSYTVKNRTKTKVKCSLAYSLSNFNLTIPCRDNTRISTKKLKAALLKYKDTISGHDISGSICIGTDGPGAAALENWDNSEDRSETMSFWEHFSKTGKLPEPNKKYTSPIASVSSNFVLAPGDKRCISFYITWHFPRRTLGRCGWNSDKESKVNVGNFYSVKYKDAWDAMKKIVPIIPKLKKQTRLFSDALLESTLPAPALDAMTANMSTLKTQTIFRTADGAFHGFEGCDDKCGCCFGDCTHVYNYEAATGMLYPQIQQSFLETAFLTNTDKRGVNSFRTMLPVRSKRLNKVSADGTMGCIARLYRLWQSSGDNEMLHRFWPIVKKIFAFTWSENSWDGDKDGVMEGVQHNTYDCEFYGPNPMCSVWYLAALKAAEKMAESIGDEKFADVCRKLFKKGSAWIDRHLFNGEYYRQIVRPIRQEKIADVYESRTGTRNRKQPYHQVENGCLIDQLVGQYYAHLCGFGHILKPENIRKTLRSIMKYNYKASLYGHPSTQRIYALNDESALVICSYPKEDRPEIPMPYCDEIMTGFEYQAAAHMIMEGQLTAGLKVVESIRRRYDGLRRNPWDEAECGHHYARAMASWSLLPALTGFKYSAVEKTISFAPRINRDKFKTFFITPTCWGTYEQYKRNRDYICQLSILYGYLQLESIQLPQMRLQQLKHVLKNTKTVAKVVKESSKVFLSAMNMKNHDLLTLKFGTANEKT